ncbi:endolytic transglycosylase MltG [Marinomonas sp. 15G1-11]|uniref:Endolytic transglycosylase MltG n=1 Tax=Marinomonas phaeophyticola TaxID=3004091 RepID=A0ABT4JV30_9GAMM|nr:endolytic transglycosylase MltG [Marinomonas sp. 15G1-11]MCZ2722244.1 endolytic transglycosylase MltG [Marinomonas sp. 15G1-11]
MEGKRQQFPLNDSYEALILASIIEKETGDASERPLISKVFVNRLRKNIRLQTDPTVIYGLGEAFDGNLTRAHLRAENPYNTYRIFGLPPTPIANVGKESIVAAVSPGETDALYFVAKGDGTHAFSRTLREHNNAVAQYQRFQRRSDYTSSPKEK